MHHVSEGTVFYTVTPNHLPPRSLDRARVTLEGTLLWRHPSEKGYKEKC